MKKLYTLLLLCLFSFARGQEPGDLAVVGISTSEMMYISLAFIPEGTVLHITDRQWNGTAWVAGADGGTGNITITVGTGGMPANSYLLIQNLATLPTVASGGAYFSNVTTSNESAYTFDFQGNNLGTCTILTVHAATTFDSDPTGAYIWVIALGNYSVLGSTYGIPENCAVNRSNNANVTATSLDANTTTGSKEEALNYLDNGANWSNGTTASALTVPLILGIDFVNTTWDGASWDSGVPTTASDAIIAGDYNTATNGAITVGDSLVIQDGVTLTIDDDTNSVINAYGTIETNSTGTVVLKGSSLGFATLPSSATFSGTGTIRYEIDVNQVGWHHFSAPATVTLGDLTFDNGMTLSYSGASANVYTWDASTSGWVTTSSGANFGAAGYTMYFSSAQIMSVPITPSNMNNEPETDALSYHNPGGSPPGNSAIGWTTAVEDGWNLVRNPYPEYLDWDVLDNDGANLTDMDASVYIWNPTSGGGTGAYESYSSAVGGMFGIHPFQAFFVRATTGTGALVKPIDVRTESGVEFLGKQQGDGVSRFRLTATVGNYSRTQAFAFLEEGRLEKDAYDTYAFQGGSGVPYFYSTTSDSVRVDNQALPKYFSSIETYLTCYSTNEGASSQISLDDQELAQFPLNVYLIDLHTLQAIDMRAQLTHSFFIDSLAPAQRFRLILSQHKVDLDEFDSEELIAYSSSDNLIVELPSSDSYTYQLIDWNGRTIEEGVLEVEANRAQITGRGGFQGIVVLRSESEIYAVKVL
ncbi:MAG: hypothetical protein HWD92_05940 [Flavobacteriia bacterium]|nr:hypothetical protein [Flavobacteriia bacterium]